MPVTHMREQRKNKNGSEYQYYHSACGVYDPTFDTPIEEHVTCGRCKKTLRKRTEERLA